MWYSVCAFIGAVVGLLAGALCFSGKITDLQEQVNTKCEHCLYKQHETSSRALYEAAVAVIQRWDKPHSGPETASFIMQRLRRAVNGMSVVNTPVKTKV